MRKFVRRRAKLVLANAADGNHKSQRIGEALVAASAQVETS
jgi:hypothetical protein